MNSYILLMAAIFLFVLHVSLYIHSLPLIQISEIKEATHVHDLRLLRTLNLKRNPVQVTSHNLHSIVTTVNMTFTHDLPQPNLHCNQKYGSRILNWNTKAQ